MDVEAADVADDVDAPQTRRLMHRPLCDHVEREVWTTADERVAVRCIKLADVVVVHEDGRKRAYCPQHAPEWTA